MGIKKPQIDYFRFLLAFIFILILTYFEAPAFAEIIPSARRPIWQGNVGVSGDIQNRTTIYTTINSGTYGNGSTDATSVIQTAINNCPSGQVVYLPAGTYKISSTITIKTGITLRGAGMGQTILLPVSTGFAGSTILSLESSTLNWELDWGMTWLTITGNPPKGSTTITTATPHGFSVGNWVQTDQLQEIGGTPKVTSVGSEGQCGTYCGRFGTRVIGQMAKVIGVPSSTSFTIDIPLLWNYNSTFSPQVAKLQAVTERVGVEDLTINNTNANIDNLSQVTMVANSWYYKVEFIGVYKRDVDFYQASRITVRGCKFHGRSTNEVAAPTNGYVILFQPRVTAVLIENNQFYDCGMVWMTNGNTEGNVFAYNYFTNPSHGPNGYTGAAVWFHGAYNTMNLLEGNQLDSRIINDLYHGSSGVNTFLRNKIRNEPGASSTRNWVIELESYSHWYNFVGNVLGTAGWETVYEGNMTFNDSQKEIYNLGYDSTRGASYSDGLVASTILRHGNWDSATNGVVWESTIPDRTIPTSYYLSSKPSWWCNETPWPPIGSDLSPMVSDIPAKIQYQGGVCTSSSPTPSPTPTKIPMWPVPSIP